MALPQLEPLQAVRPQSGGHAIHKGGKRAFLTISSDKIALHGIEGRMLKHIQADDFETIADIEIVMNGAEALSE